MNKLLSLKNIKKYFFTQNEKIDVIDNLSFDIYENEVVSLLGPSGCGKSTILNIITKLENINDGLLEINSECGYMFQKDNLLPWLNIYKNIMLGLEIKKLKNKENEELALNLIKKYGLEEFKNFYPHELSGGMRQRVSLIRTLVLKPTLLLLDEPFSALDSQTRLFVQDDLKKILIEEHLSSLLVSHDISEAISLSSRILILSNRPMNIIKEIKLNFPFDMLPKARRETALFQEYFKTIFNILNN